MSLIECAECGKEISSEAPTCPSCGIPIKQSMKRTYGWKVLVAVVVVILGVLTALVLPKQFRHEPVKSAVKSHPKAPDLRYELAKSAVKSRLKDPDSAIFSNLRKNMDGDVCGTVRAKNSMGGYGEPLMLIVHDSSVKFGYSIRCTKTYDEYVEAFKEFREIDPMFTKGFLDVITERELAKYVLLQEARKEQLEDMRLDSPDE